jgi:transposase-like protein
MEQEPKTLEQAIVYFSDPVNCRNYMVARRWPNGVICPQCGSSNILFLEKYGRWECREKHSSRQFTLKTGTVMEDSPIPVSKWLAAMWQIVNCKNGISSYEVHRAIGITQKSAWFMDHRIRLAFNGSPLGKASGHVEADETFIGGLARNMHVVQRQRRITGTGGKDKTDDGPLEKYSELTKTKFKICAPVAEQLVMILPQTESVGGENPSPNSEPRPDEG